MNKILFCLLGLPLGLIAGVCCGAQAAFAAFGSGDPLQTTATPADYQLFVQGSKAEFGIAKSGYVESQCGWFSDRSACYLASGRPVIAQNTGFSGFLPVGEGLFSFDTAEDVLTAIDAINSNYQRHSAAARSISEEHLCSKRVLNKILSSVG